jgi:hypothetical protein
MNHDFKLFNPLASSLQHLKLTIIHNKYLFSIIFIILCIFLAILTRSARVLTLLRGATTSLVQNNGSLTHHQHVKNWRKNGYEFEIAPIAGATSPIVYAGMQVDVAEPQVNGSSSAVGGGLLTSSKQCGTDRQLKADVEDQYKINHHIPVTDCARAYRLTNRFADPKLADWIYKICHTDQDYNTVFCGSELDRSGKNHLGLQYSITRYFLVAQQNWVGDKYDAQGHSEPTAGSTIRLGPEHNLFLWYEEAGSEAPINSGGSYTSSTPFVTFK